MPAIVKTCVIEQSYYEDGCWFVLAFVKIGQNTYTSTFAFEGDAAMTSAALSSSVLGFYE